MTRCQALQRHNMTSAHRSIVVGQSGRVEAHGLRHETDQDTHAHTDKHIHTHRHTTPYYTTPHHTTLHHTTPVFSAL